MKKLSMTMAGLVFLAGAAAVCAQTKPTTAETTKEAPKKKADEKKVVADTKKDVGEKKSIAPKGKVDEKSHKGGAEVPAAKGGKKGVEQK